jgi:hypothetical protein
VLTQAMFHPVWLVLVIGLAWFARRPARGRAIAIGAAAIVVALVLGLIVKNEVLVGVPGTSSWAGMNLFRTTVEQLPADQRAEMVANGRLSAASEVPSFSNYSDYEGVMEPCAPSHDAPVLAESVKSTGYVNFNYECFVPVFDQAQDDALTAIRENPAAAARAQVAAWQISFMPSEDYQYLAPNRPDLELYDDLYRSIVLLTVPVPPLVDLPTDLGGVYASPVPLSLTVLLALAAVVISTVQALRRWRRSSADAAIVATVYIGLTTLFVFVVGNGFEIGENNRFRSAVEPLMFVVLAAVIDRLLRRARWTRASAPSADAVTRRSPRPRGRAATTAP